MLIAVIETSMAASLLLHRRERPRCPPRQQLAPRCPIESRISRTRGAGLAYRHSRMRMIQGGLIRWSFVRTAVVRACYAWAARHSAHRRTRGCCRRYGDSSCASLSGEHIPSTRHDLQLTIDRQHLLVGDLRTPDQHKSAGGLLLCPSSGCVRCWAHAKHSSSNNCSSRR